MSVGLYLTSMARKELGVPQLKGFFQNEPSGEPEDISTLAVAIASGLRNKLDEIQILLNRSSSRVVTSLNASTKHGDSLSLPTTSIPPCCSSKRRSGGSMCNAAPDLTGKPDSERRVLFTIRGCFDDNRQRSSLFGRQFIFGNFGELHLESPPIELCVRLTSEALTFRRRQIETMTLDHRQKNVVIILERGSDQTANELNLGRLVSLNLIKSLSPRDRVGLITVSNVAEFVEPATGGNGGCILDKLSFASPWVLNSIEQHLNRIHHTDDAGRTDPTSGFRFAKKLIDQSDLEPSAHLQIIFVTTWKNINYKQSDSVLEILTGLRSDRSNLSVKVFHLVEHFPSDNETDTEPSLIKLTGGSDDSTNTDYVRISLAYNLVEKVSFGQTKEKELSFSILPVAIDPVTQEYVVSIARAVGQQNLMIGVDVPYERLFQDVVYFSSGDIRVSVLDKLTTSFVYHPYLYDRINKKYNPILGQINFEELEHQDVISKILESTSGSYLRGGHVEYAWQHVKDSPYVIVVASNQVSSKDMNQVTHSALEVSSQDHPRVFFHRMDTLSTKQQNKLCRHFMAPATLESGSIFLSASAFYDPLSLPKILKSQNAESYLAYLTDKTNLISNPGIRSGVREDVLKIIQVTTAWKNMSYDSGLNNYIIRRFAATSRGLYYVYPGSPSSSDYDPTRQEWFYKAKQFRERVVTTLPRLDPGGGGYIVSLSQAILNEKGDVLSIVGMDLTLGYIYKLVLETSPFCREDNVRCFLFDDEGYLVVHPDMFLVGEMVERQHLMHREPLVAGDILRQKEFVQKLHCLRHTDATVQRFYNFNTSYSRVLTNALKDGSLGEETCTKYRVSSIHGTNLFLGIVETDQNCTQTAVAFCPCSVEDHWCMLCPEEEDTEGSCECPCQCLQDFASPCRKENSFLEPVCPDEVQRLESVSPLPRDVLLSSLPLPPCFERDCSRRSTKESCFGVIGCSWCEKEAVPNGGKTIQLANPFCGELSRCYFGIIGGKSPYETIRRDEGVSGGRSLLRDVSQVSSDDFFLGQPSSSVGPIAGGIVGCFVFLAISVCCLRGQQKCSLVNAGTGNRNDSSLHVSHLEEEAEEEFEQGEEMQELSAHVDILRIAPAQEAQVSPYQMNPTYRRPPPGTDSDHGYSTMTPMGGDLDSEIVPYTDSASARDRLRKRPIVMGPPSSLQSVTSGMSSRTASPVHIGSMGRPGVETSALLSDGSEDTSSRNDPPLQTQLSKHQFLVAATVHMEAQ